MVLTTLEELFPNISLNQENQIRMPVFMAYADDLILVARNSEQLGPIIAETVQLLESVGLNINISKCNVLVRDPKGCFQESEISLSDVPFKVVKTMKYLGTYLTSSLNRPLTIRKRCHQAIGLVKNVSDFVQKFNVPSQIVVKIYNMVIVPTITYGLKSAALTKANRSRLRKYEQFLLTKLLEHCPDISESVNIRELLKGQTITKKIRMFRICYWGHIQRRPQSHILHASLNYAAGRKKVGRPCMTFNDCLKKDLESISDMEWHELAQNRDELKKSAELVFQMGCSSSDSEDMVQENPSHSHIGQGRE